MTYLVIDVDGALHVRDTAPTSDAIHAEVGYWDTVRLTAAGGTLRGFVDDTGLIDGNTPRNVVGSLMLMCCGAGHQPYAGPVVITGWDPRPSDESEIRPLPPDLVQALNTMHGCVTQVLAGDGSCPSCSELWKQQIRRGAELVRTAPTPTIQFLTGDDALNALRRSQP